MCIGVHDGTRQKMDAPEQASLRDVWQRFAKDSEKSQNDRIEVFFEQLCGFRRARTLSPPCRLVSAAFSPLDVQIEVRIQQHVERARDRGLSVYVLFVSIERS